MPQAIRTIRLALPFRMGSVNCYLLAAGGGFVLIDTGGSNQRRQLEVELEGAGCRPGDLKLIVITHGDFDHTGNAAYLRQRFSAPIAMHAADLGMAEQADMFYNRSQGNALLKALVPRFSGFRKADRFTPDLTIGEGFDLSGYGLDARVVDIPGHSKGSIGVLTASGDLFCGDLLANTDRPGLSGIMDDPATAAISLEKLRGYPIETVYPGHGEPFRMEQLDQGE
jgi:glyoxylase-like metal-dependent hydrolase (beta-lactamase superfamily II)